MISLLFIGCFNKPTDIPEPAKQQIKEIIAEDMEAFQQGVDLNGDGVPDTASNLEVGMKVQKIDINGDGQVDVINHYKTRDDGTEMLMYKSVDMNWDGKTDVQTWFNINGEIEKEAMDGDFDGLSEWVDHYKGNKLIMSEIDSDFDGKYDLFRIYKSERLEEKRYDSDGDGKIDFWQYYDANGALISTGRDNDGDGKVDERN